MSYVDGFLIPVPKKNLAAYFKMSKKAGKIWKEHGALEYRECAGDDLKHTGEASFHASFETTLKLKPGETAVFAWIVYKSRAHRDKVNAKVMADPRIAAMSPAKPPFDMKRMNYGGFKMEVDI